MIIYNENQPPLLSDYGIEIPMLKGRAERVRNELIKKYSDHILSSREVTPLVECDFLRAHTKDFVEKCKKYPQKVIEETFELIGEDGQYYRYNPNNAKKMLPELVDLYAESCAFSYLSLLEATEKSFSYYLGGGFHHSLSDKGRGFCLFNDIVIAARKYQHDVRQGIVWVIDIDAHKGCGTAEMTEHDDSILTFSIHMENGWPLDSEKNDKNGKLNPWFIPSTIDIGIKEGEENLYIEKLSQGLLELKKQSNDLPVMCIVVDGSDPFDKDALPSSSLLRLSKEQCLERNLVVYNFLKKYKIPQAYVMSGGYGDENWIIHHQFLDRVLKDF